MHVSRVLYRSLAKLRDAAENTSPVATGKGR
jgi:hypothetical protein